MTASEVGSKIKKIIIDASPLLFTLPGHPSIRSLLLTILSFDLKDAFREKKNILRNLSISSENKLTAVNVLLKSAFATYKTAKLRGFIFALLILFTFVYTNDTALFLGLMGQLRQILKSFTTKDGLTRYVIETYMEYNAPFPKELVELAKKLD